MEYRTQTLCYSFVQEPSDNIPLESYERGEEERYEKPELVEAQPTLELIQGPWSCGHDSPTSWGDINC